MGLRDMGRSGPKTGGNSGVGVCHILPSVHLPTWIVMLTCAASWYRPVFRASKDRLTQSLTATCLESDVTSIFI